MKEPEFVEKRKKGPVVLMMVAAGGPSSLRTSLLLLWILYCVVVFAAYITGRALESSADYLAVFRFAGASAFMGYSLALRQNSIWYRRNWGAPVTGHAILPRSGQRKFPTRPRLRRPCDDDRLDC